MKTNQYPANISLNENQKSINSKEFLKQIINTKIAHNLPKLLAGQLELSFTNLSQISRPLSGCFCFISSKDNQQQPVNHLIKGHSVNIAEIKGGIIVTSKGQPISSQGEPFYFRHAEDFDEKIFEKRVFHRHTNVATKYKNIFVLSTVFPDNYSHWITQILISAKAFQDYVLENQIEDYVFAVPANTFAKKWKTSSLAFTGIDPKKNNRTQSRCIYF